MNRYVVEGMVADARKGWNVLYVGQSMDMARNAAVEVRRHLGPRNGHPWEIRTSSNPTATNLITGGQIKFSSIASKMWIGYRADYVAVETWGRDNIPDDLIRLVSNAKHGGDWV